jgi:hypothetical protein
VEDVGDGVEWGRCLQIRVYIDLTKLLERGCALAINGKSLWVLFKYENLPQFCYHCGKIYHADKSCTRKTNFRLNDDVSAKPWGAWLRADDLRLGLAILTRPVNFTRTRHKYIGFGFRL